MTAPTISILEEMCGKDLYLNKRFLDFIKSLDQNFLYRTHIQQNQSKGSSMNKVIAHYSVSFQLLH